MRDTKHGFSIIVKAADSAAEEFRRRPEIASLFLILEAWGVDPLSAPESILQLAESYRRLVVGWRN